MPRDIVVKQPVSAPCLRLETIDRFGEEEDEFEAEIYSCTVPTSPRARKRRLSRATLSASTADRTMYWLECASSGAL
jgi:hypothetical protein